MSSETRAFLELPWTLHFIREVWKLLIVSNIFINMNKKILAGAIGLAMFTLPFIASAATVTSNAVFDGQTQVYGNAGSNVQATFQVDVPAGEVLHAIRTKVDSQPTVCTAIGPFEGAQTVDTSVNITLPPNTNNHGYNFVADLYYTDTLPQAEAMTGDLACTSNVGGSHVNTAAYSGGTVVNVLPSSGGTTGSSSSSSIDALTALVAQLAAQVQAILHPVATAPAPTPVSAVCQAYDNANAGTQANVYNSSNKALQGFLLSQHIDIPALNANPPAAFGFYGNQTTTAVGQFNSVNHCN